MEGIKGYKVFNPDWTCSPGGNTKQYACPGKFEEEGELEVCGHGMHFCKKVIDCFVYYEFNEHNKVAEVVAYGEVKTLGNKSCTDKLEIVREISWKEVLDLVNIGSNCNGYGNTENKNTGNKNSGKGNRGNYNAGAGNLGDRNTGSFNTGDDNSGNRNKGNDNTGNENVGHFNVGNVNVGDFNVGKFNIGDGNVGSRNIGDRNVGIGNIGKLNTGGQNIGDFNAGKFNIGDRNIGDGNIGQYNIGDWNKSSFNTGCFNTEDPTIMLFNKPSDMTYREWMTSDAKRILDQMPMSVTRWVDEEDMTDEEKEDHSCYKTMGGYLSRVSKQDQAQKCQLWWDELSEEDKQTIKSIPNFDADIFYECTGIRV